MRYCFDIDGTICNTNCDYRDAKPYQKVIDWINKKYKDGHRIQFFTSRVTLSGKDWTEFTKNQLAEWGVFYHELTLGKPHFDLFVDDKCLNNEDWYNSEGLEV